MQQRYQSVPPLVLEDADVLELVAKPLRADIEAFETYRYVQAEPLACPIHAFGGVDDAMVSYESLEAWRLHTPLDFQLEMLPGGHLFLQSPQSRLLASIAERFRPAAACIPAGMLLWRGPFLCAES